ncbi:ribonuclease H-like domain-containing protein [Tanacetum coccineum]
MLHGVDFEVKPQDDRGFEVEPIGICDLGFVRVINEDAHESLTFRDVVAFETEIRTAKSFLDEVKENILGMGIFKNHNGNTLTVSRFRYMVTIRCFPNLVVQSNWSMFQLNVNSAFLYGDLDETIYMKLPDGYYPGNDTRVCRLKKSLYGLKQAPRQWNAKLTSALTKNGISQSKSDYSFLGKGFLCIVEIEKFKEFLKTKFMIKDLEKLKYFLSIKVIDTKEGIYFNQRKYCLDLLSEFGMLACKPLVVPLPSKLVISNEPIDDDPLVDNITEYKKLIGSPGMGIHITKDSGISLFAYFDAD